PNCSLQDQGAALRAPHHTDKVDPQPLRQKPASPRGALTITRAPARREQKSIRWPIGARVKDQHTVGDSCLGEVDDASGEIRLLEVDVAFGEERMGEGDVASGESRAGEDDSGKSKSCPCHETGASLRRCWVMMRMMVCRTWRSSSRARCVCSSTPSASASPSPDPLLLGSAGGV